MAVGDPASGGCSRTMASERGGCPGAFRCGTLPAASRPSGQPGMERGSAVTRAFSLPASASRLNDEITLVLLRNRVADVGPRAGVGARGGQHRSGTAFSSLPSEHLLQFLYRYIQIYAPRLSAGVRYPGITDHPPRPRTGPLPARKGPHSTAQGVCTLGNAPLHWGRPDSAAVNHRAACERGPTGWFAEPRRGFAGRQREASDPRL